MDPKVVQFLSNERICCLTTTIGQSIPHSAAMHYYFDESNETFVFLTEKNSVKCTNLAGMNSVSGAVVVGFNEGKDVKTMQLRGSISVVEQSDLTKVRDKYLSKFPDKTKYETTESVYLCFVPNWWRFRDYSTKPMTVVTSKDNI